MDISEIGRQFGLNEAQTRAALEQLAPVVAAGVRKNAQSGQGLQDIFRTVLTGGHDQAIEDPRAVQYENVQQSGDEILKQIFGSKDVSRGVAQQLSATSGIGAAILKKLLPIVASIVMGQVAKKMGAGSGQNTGGGGFGDILKDILGGGQSGGGMGGGGLGGGGLGGGGSVPADIPNMPDSPLGNPGSASRQTRRMEMPEQQFPDVSESEIIPPQGQRRSSGNPLEDMLNDILAGNGGKGGVVVKQIPADQMGDILKDIFGGQFPGGSQAPDQQSQGAQRGRRAIEDATGDGTSTGNMADDLLNSVERSLRRG